MSYQSTHRVSGFYRIFAVGVLTLLFSLFLASIAHATPAVGATPGQLTISNTGAAHYRVPINLPAGTAGMRPSLSLTYSSRRGNGIAGWGWALSGLSRIHRCLGTYPENGEIRTITYTDADFLCLNGTPMRAVSGSYGQAGAVYRLARENFTRITQHGSGTSTYFEVAYKNGRKAYFGKHHSAAPLNDAGTAIRAWYISRLFDRSTNRNAVVYRYQKDPGGAIVPDTIGYTVSDITSAYYTIQFQYENRPAAEIIPVWRAGNRVGREQRLSRIEVLHGSQVVKYYQLAYEGALSPQTQHSRLASITECGQGGMACFAPLTFDWQNQASQHTVNEIFIPSAGRGILWADINGDGREDYYCWGGDRVVDPNPDPYDLFVEPEFTELGYSITAPDGSVSGGCQATGIAWDLETMRSAGVVDIDGDGDDEVIFTVSGDTDTTVAGWVDTTVDIINPDTVIKKVNGKDLNGDGYDDSFGVGAGGIYIQLNTNNPHVQQASVDYLFPMLQNPIVDIEVSRDNVPDPYVANPAQLITESNADFDGDGRSDLIISALEEKTVCTTKCVTLYDTHWYIAYSRITNTGGTLQLLELKDLGEQHIHHTPMDINADGLTDLVYYDYNLERWYTRLSTGAGFQAPINAGTGSFHGSLFNSNNVVQWVSVADVNNDDLPDLLFSYATENTHPSYQCPRGWPQHNYRWKVKYATGTTLSAAQELPLTQPGELNCLPPTVYNVDLNGDGSREIIIGRKVNWVGSQANAYAPAADSLIRIIDSFDNPTRIDYASLADATVHSRYPQPAITDAYTYVPKTYAVESYKVNDRYTVDYHYIGGVKHRFGRGFLGFAKRTVTDSRKPGVKVTEWFKQAFPYIGITYEKLLTGPNGKITKTTITPAKKTWGSGDQQRVLVYPATTVEKSYKLDTGDLLKTTTRTLSNLDDFGNPRTITTEVTDGTNTFTTTKSVNFYHNYTAADAWCLGNPDTTTLTRDIPGTGIDTQTTSAQYDPAHCRATQQTLQAAGNSPAVITDYLYDAWGNVKQSTVSAPNAVPVVVPRTTKASYSVYQGRFPDTLTNAANHNTTLTWDTTLGLKETVTDPNGLTTTFAYDAFGRLKTTDYPDARATTLGYEWCSAGNCGVTGGVYRINQSRTQTTASGADAITVYDAFGRKIKTGARGLGGIWTYQYTDYNALGQVAQQSQPWQSGTVYWTQYNYDLLGRVTTVQHPLNLNSGAGGGQTTTDYNGFSTTITNAKGQVTTKVENAIGQTIKVTDALTNMTRYEYDAAGNLTKTIDPLGNEISMAYDNRGNKISMNDPDMGHWTYAYNAFGEMIQQTDAKDQITKMFYDKLGRLTKRIEGAGTTAAITSQWIYGAVNGIGKLESVTQSGGFEKIIKYDNLSRPVETVVKLGAVDTVDYKTSTAYDQYSRITAIQYPYSIAAVNNPVNAVARVADDLIEINTTVSLDGSASSDGESYEQALSYQWTQTAGPDTTINDAASVTATLTPSEPGNYTFQLTVSDGADSATDTVSVAVVPAPARNLTISDGSKSHDGAYTVSWDAPAGGLPTNSEYRLYESASPDFSPEHSLANITSRSFNVAGKTNGPWNYRLVVCQVNLCSTDVTVHVEVELPPGPPGTPTIDDGSISIDGSYKVIWTAPAVGTGEYDNYILYESPGTPEVLGGSIHNLSQPGQANDTTYTYRVEACNGDACTSSDTGSVKVIIPPGQPASLSVPDNTSTGSATINWGSASGDVDYYQLQEATDAGFVDITRDWTPSGNTQTVSLNGNDKWYYRVRACNEHDSASRCSGWLEDTSGLRNYEAPSWLESPTFSDGDVSTDGDYSVDWSAPTGQFTELTDYVLIEDPGNGRWELNSDTLSQPISNQPNGNTYSYTVKACNGNACTTSNTHSIKVVIPPGRPTSISFPSTTTDGSETITWKTPIDDPGYGDVDYYQLQEAKTSSFANLTHNWTQSSLARDVNLSGNGTWYYRVRACNTYSNVTRCGGWRTGSHGLRNDEAPGIVAMPTISDGAVSFDGSYTVDWTKPIGLVTHYILLEAPGIYQWKIDDPNTLSQALDNRATDTTYTYHLKACNHAACTASQGRSIKVIIAPDSPTSLDVPNSTNTGSATIAWGTATGEMDYYQLQEAKTASFGSLTNNWIQDVGTTRVVSLSGNDTWYYRVRACNDYSTETQCSGWREASNGLRNDEAPASVAAPSISDGSISSDGSYTINWPAPSGPITGYVLTENPGNVQWSLGAGTRSQSVTGRANDTTYSYQLKACNKTACTTSSARSIKVIRTPDTPTSISVPNSSNDGSENISWGAVSSYVNHYQLQEATSTGFGSLTHNWIPASSPHTVSLNGNDTWYYRVRACNDYDGDTRCGGWRTDTTGLRNDEAPGTPAAPTISDGSVSNDGSYTVNWSKPSGSVTDYVLMENPGNGQWTLGAGTLRKAFSGRNNATTYSYQVKACRYTACSSASASRSVHVIKPPGTPSSIAVPNTTYDGAETISWGAASGRVSYYQLQQSTSTSFASPSTWSTSSRARSVSVNGNDTWYYRVRACNDYANTVRCGGWRSDSQGLRNYERPGTPGGISASYQAQSFGGDVTVTWSEAAGYQNRYELYRQFRTSIYDSWGAWNRVQNTNTRSYSQFESPPAIVRFRVRACNGPVCSGYATSSQVRIADPNMGPKCPPLCDPTFPANDKPATDTRVASATPGVHYPAAKPMQVNTANAYGFHAQPPARPYDLLRRSRAGGNASSALSSTATVGAASHAANATAQKASYKNQFASSLKASGDNSGYRFSVNYIYGDYGHLTHVVSAETGKVYWQATKADAFGHITQVQLGNGITTHNTYDPATGYLTAIESGLMTGSDIQNQHYTWDPLGNLTSRQWSIDTGLNTTTHTEGFDYDALNRLTRTRLNNVVMQTLSYNALGNITSKTGMGAYTYGPGQITGTAGIHAITSVNGNTYSYDANGNMTSVTGSINRQITWNAANYPTTITKGATTKTFTYGPAKQRYWQQTTTGSGTETTITIGGLYQQTEKPDGSTIYQHYIRAAGKTIAIHTRRSNYTQDIQYLHRDHLGSIVAITDADGDVTARMSYDAFGARRQIDGQGTATNPLPDIDRGYTGHQMLDEVGLIHMNGRVYDPAIGRFLSADPIIQFPYSSQSYNRYSYVRNNPLSVTDPSGFVEQQDCGPDLNCDGEINGNEGERARDKCYRQSGEQCEIMDNRDGTFTSVPQSEVEQYITDVVVERLGNSGTPVSEEEMSLLNEGDFMGFWESRFENGDPLARTALIGWGEYKLTDATPSEIVLAKIAWAELDSYITANGLNVTMQQLGLELAIRHANAVTKDRISIDYLLSPRQAADYHHEVFARHGIPAYLFGGTHAVPLPQPIDLMFDLTGWQRPRFDANAYSELWCGGCDTVP